MPMNRISRGFTLIEALVALLILSIGLLGVAAMQLKALQGAHMGYQRSLASLIAIDAQERAWALLAASSDGTCPEASDSDLADWLGSESESEGWAVFLPGITTGSGISGGPSDDCEYTVTLTWGDDRLAGGETVGTFIYDFKLPGG